MNWFNRKKKKIDLDFEIIRKDIPVTDIARWFIYDTGLSDPNEMASILGINPDSEEGQEKQEEDSDIRMEEISYLVPFMELMADIVANAITGIQVAEISEKEPENIEEIKRETTTMGTMYKVIAMTSLMSAFSAAMEIGLISHGEIELTDTKEDDDE